MNFVFLQVKICISKSLWRAAHIKFFISSRIRSVLSSHALASLLRDVYHVKRSEDLVGKMISPLIFVTNGSFKLIVNVSWGPARGGPRSLVGILKCLVLAFCQGFMSLSEIKWQTFIFVGIFVNKWQTVHHSCT